MKYSKDVIPTWYQQLPDGFLWITFDADLQRLERKLSCFKAWGAKIHARPEYNKYSGNWRTAVWKNVNLAKNPPNLG